MGTFRAEVVQERPYVVAGQRTSDFEQVEAPEVSAPVGF